MIALLHRTAFDAAMPHLVGLHTPEEDRWFFRKRVFAHDEVWVAEDDGSGSSNIIGYCAVRSGWLNQLYVDPLRWARGTGSALLEQARADRPALQLWTFQCNSRARRFYEARGFVLAELTDGSGNKENEPDARYVWSR
ncbi:GNAT family N-acetyltransferase [Thalassobaculum sp.]|uniref:GNAT family N-acetyltransferase n=1 Tax=Thalassobaculum sp. TaxID=2022740 RepID=UPI0032EE8B8E